MRYRTSCLTVLDLQLIEAGPTAAMTAAWMWSPPAVPHRCAAEIAPTIDRESDAHSYTGHAGLSQTDLVLSNCGICSSHRPNPAALK